MSTNTANHAAFASQMDGRPDLGQQTAEPATDTNPSALTGLGSGFSTITVEPGPGDEARQSTLATRGDDEQLPSENASVAHRAVGTEDAEHPDKLAQMAQQPSAEFASETETQRPSATTGPDITSASEHGLEQSNIAKPPEDATMPDAPAPAMNPSGHTMDGAQTTSAVSLESDDNSESDTTDVDSAIGSWRSARTQSLTSSVLDFKFENGRRYHAFRDGDYHLPNDESEQDRLDMQHQIFRLALDSALFRAPKPHDEIFNVLDVGCGTGLWAIDVADLLPHAQVIGFDLSPIQPDVVPPNCKFLVDDCNSEWLFAERFDLVHTRALTPGVRDWSRYLSQAYSHLKPGGYIELHEIGIPALFTSIGSGDTPALVKWSEHVLEAGLKAGLDFGVPKRLGGLLQEAGFEDVNIAWQNWPVGTWAKGSKNKQIGHWWATDLIEVSRSTSALFTRVLGWSNEEFEVLAASIANEVRENKKHVWLEMFFGYARKPLST